MKVQMKNRDSWQLCLWLIWTRHSWCVFIRDLYFRLKLLKNMTKELSFHKKRKGVVKTSSLTKLSSKITDLEANLGNPTTLENARNSAEKLKTLNKSSRVTH